MILEYALYISIGLFGVILLCYLLYKWYTYYPRIRIEVNITKKQYMNENDFLDFYIINYGTEQIENHLILVNNWKEKKINKMKDNISRINRFNNKCNKYNHNCFTLVGYREQTRYRQKNYVKYPYKVQTVTNIIRISDVELLKRVKFLKEHDYHVTYNNFNSNDQRKALTKELKEAIKKRDKYTCRECGKVMLDEVGLHIDHIIPVSKGGKSIPSNLRVLCSKCNGRKGAK